MTATLCIIRGVPGSGKSTVARQLIEAGEYVCLFEADEYFTKDGVYQFDGSQIKAAHKACYTNVVNALTQGKRVIVANTFTRKWEFAEYVEFCNTHNILYTIMVLEPKYRNVHNVPQSTVHEMIARFER